MSTAMPLPFSKPAWQPHDYQVRAIKLLLSQASGGLFLDPGLGKTSVCLAAFKILKAKGYASKVLIIAPLRPVYKVWPDEIEKWADFGDLSYTILHGPNKRANLEVDADIYIINPEGLLWLFEEKLNRPQWDILIIDESTKFKDSTTRRFRLLRPLLTQFARRWILTGTPSPNGLEDLFGQIYILDLGRSLGKYITHFRLNFLQRAGFNLYDWKPRPGAFQEIVEKLKPLVIQLSAEDYLEMPELVLRTIPTQLSKQVMEQYRAVEDDFISVFEAGKIVAANAAVAGMKCRQIANGAVYDADRNVIPIHDEKLDALESLLEELAGKPTIVLYEFNHDLDRILKRIPGTPVLGSGVSKAKLDATIDGFNRGEIPILLGHPASMGHGLNLQGSCHHIIWFGITWNLEHYDQTIARVYRQGQKSSHVFVYHIVAKDTLDERVVKALEVKDRTQQTLLSALGDCN
jgi:SNF2 family DNA or RNA helicase